MAMAATSPMKSTTRIDANATQFLQEVLMLQMQAEVWGVQWSVAGQGQSGALVRSGALRARYVCACMFYVAVGFYGVLLVL